MTTRGISCCVLIIGCASATTGQRSTSGVGITPTVQDGRQGVQTSQPVRGLILAPGAGERLAYCERPLVLTLKVDSLTAPATSLLAGIGELRGDEGVGRHRTADEVVYVARGWGHAALGTDTVRLGPGSVLYVPPGTPHRLVSSGPAPMTYFFVLGPASSAAGFRRAATLGCPGAPAAGPAALEAAPQPAVPTTARPVAVEPGEGERITYCAFPLTITAKVDSNAMPGARLTAAVGALRRGAEAGTHRLDDEVVYVTHGRGRAFVGADTAAVEPGSVVFTPRGVRHGFINDGAGTLEYFIVYSEPGPRSAFRTFAARPGPHCPGGGAP